MSSVVRGQANLHDSFESNGSNASTNKKRIPDTIVNDEEAAALLHHMHLMHHNDHPLPSENPIHADRHHQNGPAAGPHHIADRETLQQRRARQIVAENSSSSDASATNYFSGDSDLTAEPIMDCTANEDGAKSSNSGSSTVFKVPCRAFSSSDQAQALGARSLGQEYSFNLPEQHVGNTHAESAQISTSGVLPSTSTTSMSMPQRKASSDSKLLPSSELMHKRATRLQADGADSKSGSDSWLELRLGSTTELQHRRSPNLEAHISARDGRKKSTEEWDDMTMLRTPVTLQLLPENYKVSEINIDVGGAIRPGIAGFGLYSDPPLVYHPEAGAFCDTRPKFTENHNAISRLAASDSRQVLLSKNKDSAAAASKHSDHSRFPLNQSNDPAADLFQRKRRLALTGYDSGNFYDQAHGYVDSNDQRMWMAAERSHMTMTAAPPPITATRPAEIYRPTASLGWASSNATTRSWSADSYTPPIQIQRAMSWQGLLRSMTTDPLLHPLPEVPMCSFDPGTDFAGSRGRRHMFSEASANRRQSGHSMPTNQLGLRLATSRRNAGLWFSLQEAHHFPNENSMEDEDEQHSNMQKLYLRIRDGRMQISVLQSYLVRKLASSGSHHYEIEITCRGKILAPTLTIQHVRDTIWLNKDFELNGAIGFRFTDSYISDSHNRVMALCYQRHHTQTVTLNLLKT